MKFCNVCGIEKSIDDFCINKSKKDGRNTICKDCVKIKNNIYYKNNRNKSLEYQKNYIKNNKDKIKEYQENYYQDNRKNLLEEAKVRSKIYYENNK